MDGHTLASRRRALGRSQRDLARELDLTVRTILRWEQGKVPPNRVEAVEACLRTWEESGPLQEKGVPGVVLERMRRALGLTRAELAERLTELDGQRVAPGTVADWEAVRVPPRRHELLEAFFGSRLEYELAREDGSLEPGLSYEEWDAIERQQRLGEEVLDGVHDHQDPSPEELADFDERMAERIQRGELPELLSDGTPTLDAATIRAALALATPQELADELLRRIADAE